MLQVGFNIWFTLLKLYEVNFFALISHPYKKSALGVAMQIYSPCKSVKQWPHVYAEEKCQLPCSSRTEGNKWRKNTETRKNDSFLFHFIMTFRESPSLAEAICIVYNNFGDSDIFPVAVFEFRLPFSFFYYTRQIWYFSPIFGVALNAYAKRSPWSNWRRY